MDLGMYRGLKFSLDLSPHENPAVCVEGAVTRYEPLSREHRGPRAIMNAVTRLVDSYEDERTRAAKDLEIAVDNSGIIKPGSAADSSMGSIWRTCTVA